MRLGVANGLGEWRKRNMPLVRTEARKRSEDRARELLAARVGQLGAGDLRRLFDLLDEDAGPGAGKRRFGPTLAKPNYDSMVAALGLLNEWVSRLWTADSETAPALVDDFAQANPVKGARQLLASILLYLRDPE